MSISLHLLYEYMNKLLVCSLSDLTGGKFGGNRAALVSLPHSAHGHLVTRAGTQNLRNKVTTTAPFSRWNHFTPIFSVWCSDTDGRQTLGSDCLTSTHTHTHHIYEYSVITPKPTLNPTISNEQWFPESTCLCIRMIRSAELNTHVPPLTCSEYWLSVGCRRKVVRGPSPPTRP